MEKIHLLIQLTRLDKPIGILLLFWPCLWGLTLGYYLNDSQNLYRLSSNGLIKEKLFSDITSVKQDCSTQKLYVMKSSQRKLFEFLPNTFDLIETGINEEITFSRNWAVQNNEFIFLKDNKLTKTSLFTLNKKAIKLPLGSFKYFQLANSRIFLSRRLINETSIKQIVEVK